MKKLFNLTPLVKKYGSGYVARQEKTGKVIAHSKRIDILLKKIKSRSDVFISWLPKEKTRYVFRIPL